MTGAARLAAAAARRAGAGMLTIAAESGADVYRTGDAGVIVSEAPLAELLHGRTAAVWVCGPGLGRDEARDGAAGAARGGRDGRRPTRTCSRPSRASRMRCGRVAVLTPHAGEFARVFGDPGRDRLARGARGRGARTGAASCC